MAIIIFIRMIRKYLAIIVIIKAIVFLKFAVFQGSRMPDQVGRCSHHEGKRLEAGYPQILSSSSALSDATSLLSDALLSSADM